MRKGLFVFGLALVFTVAASAVQAGPNCGSKAACGTKQGCDGSGCPAALTKLVKELPRLTYHVGDFTTRCRVQATKKSQETGSPIVYAVGEETFGTEDAAIARVVEQLESTAARLASVRYVAGENCYASFGEAARAANGAALKYSVAGYTFETQEEADKAAQVVSDALVALAEGKATGQAGCSASCTAKKADGNCASTCGKAQTASAEGKAGCASDCAGRAKTASHEGKAGCSGPCEGKCAGKCDGKCEGKCAGKCEGKCGCGSENLKAQTASAEGKPGCAGQAKCGSAKSECACSEACQEACKDRPVTCCSPESIITAMQKIKTIVTAAATVAS